MARVNRWLPILFFLLLPVVGLWRTAFFGETIGPFDQVRQMQPWGAPPPERPFDALTNDGVLQFYPWRDLVFRAYQQGKLPLWNPYELAGTPLLANSQSGGLYPLHIAIGVLHVPTGTGIALLAWFHLAWAGLGLYLLARRLSAGRLGAMLGGASFALSAFMLGWTPLPSVIETVSWIPWTLAFALWIFQEPKAWRAVAGLALSIGMTLLAGHLQFAAYGLIAFAIVVAWQTAILYRGGLDGPLKATLAALLGLLIAAPQLVPVLDYAKFSHRRGAPTEQGYAGYVASAVQPFELGVIAEPSANGLPGRWSVVDGQKAPSYWSTYARVGEGIKIGANFAESAVTLGPLILVLLFFVDWRERRNGAFAVLGLVGLLLATGTALNRALYFGVPGWAATGSPNRAGCLFVLAACALAATGFSRRSLDPKRLGGAIATIILLLLARQAASFEGPTAAFAAVRDIQTAPVISLAAFSALVAFGAIFISIRKPEYLRAAALAPILIALPWAFDLIPTGKPLDPIPGDPNERYAVINDGGNLYPASPVAVAPPNTLTASGLHEIGGYDSLLHRDTVAMLREIDGKDPATVANGNLMVIRPSANPQSLASAGVTRVLVYDPASKKMIESRLPGGGRISAPKGEPKILSEDTEGLTVRAQGPGVLTVRDRLMPGWRASIDGKETPILGDFWRSVQLPEGEHTITFEYRPRGLELLWPSAIAFVALCALLLAPAKARG